MFKIIILGILLFVNLNTNYCQSKFDYVWLFGQGVNAGTDTTYGIMEYNFNTRPIQKYRGEMSLDFATSSLYMSDSLGQLQFYSNGCEIMNTQDKIMKNGNKINPGKRYDNNCVNGEDYGGFFGFLSIPKPGTPDHYLVFHNPEYYTKLGNVYDDIYDGLNFSEIDMTKQNGLGEVIKKGVNIFKDTLDDGYISACKHGNHQDWWIVKKKNYSNTWYKILVTKDTIYKHSSQQMGKFDDYAGGGSGQYSFSKDGHQFATYNMTEQIQVFDFDRNTGEFTKVVYLDLQDSVTLGGCAFSSSGRFLYVSNFFKLFQFDLWAADIQASKTLIGEWDGVKINNFFIPNINGIFHGPDCKLYISSSGSSRYLHVINNPDAKGAACDFVQRGIKTTWYYWQTPHFPHYRTGTPYENYCDTITSTGTPILYFAPNVKVYPNPVQDMLQIEVLGLQSWRTGTFRLFDSMGRLIQEHQLFADSGALEINTLSLPKGIYAWSVYLEGFGVQSGEVIKP